MSQVNVDDEEILREVYSSNGLPFGQFQREVLSCQHLEMFFSGYPRMIGLEHFPNLQTLCLVAQAISHINGLGYLLRLRELWIVECQLESMSGLEDLRSVRRLFLYSNCIRRIENLDHLTELNVLHLNDNKITKLEGLSELKQLKELNLAENMIERIGTALNPLQNLEILELSGNRINSLKDLTNLSRLASLHTVGFKSPIYSACPVSLLCNYSIHVIYHLPQMTCLDGIEISGKYTRDLTEMTVNKKKTFYKMMRKQKIHDLSQIQKKLFAAKEEITQPTVARLRSIHCLIREIESRIVRNRNSSVNNKCNDSIGENESEENEDEESPKQNGAPKMQARLTTLQEQVKVHDKRLAELEHFHLEAVKAAEQFTNEAIRWIDVELESVGNVRVEYGKPSDPWYAACRDLVLSRFCSRDFKSLNVSGIRIDRILRLNNRCLRSRFESALRTYTGDDDGYNPSNKQNAHKKRLEYLFWINDPGLVDGVNNPTQIIEEGFMSGHVYEKLGRDAAVPLTNSVSISDGLRIKHCVQLNVGKDYLDVLPFRKGRIFVAKVYLGKTIQAVTNDRIEQSSYPEADSVFRLRKDSPEIHTTLGSGDSGDGLHCECANRQCEWFVFDNELVLPEYIVDFEYTSWLLPRSPFHSVLENLLTDQTPDGHSLLPNDNFQNDEDDELISQITHEIKFRPRMSVLSDDLILKCAKATALEDITVLSLHDQGLTKLKPIQSLTALRKLVLSFNELTKLDDVANMKIEYLDASFNKITSVEGMRNMTKLTHLNLSWNLLENTRDDISFLRKHAPVLSDLDLRNNPWQKAEGLRLRAIGRLKSLAYLNGVTVDGEESTMALRLAAGSRILQFSLLTHSRTDTVLPKTLHLQSTAKILEQQSRMKPEKLDQPDGTWMLKVTSVCIDGQHISKLSGLERLENLRWASFCDNDITRIEGLDRCTRLEELYLENNCIRRIEGISHLRRLKHLSLGHNFISSLKDAGLENLNELQVLSVENNRLCSLAALQHLPQLTELFLADNRVEVLREVFFLKNLQNLTILDLSGNPVSSNTESYRHFVIFHLKTIKALDGMSVEPLEIAQAKDLFGGRLSQDFVAEKLGHSSFDEIKELDFAQCGLQTIDIADGSQFQNLRSLNLEHNNLTSFGGLVALVHLKVLCLNHNHVESIVPKSKLKPSLSKSNKGINTTSQPFAKGADFDDPVLGNLEVLHLGYNNIKDLVQLQLNRLPSLKALFLQGNEISKIEGIEKLRNLLELVLDRNRIKTISEFSFISQKKLQELHLEENRLQSLANLNYLENVQRLYVGLNKIQDLGELEKLDPLAKLSEISLASNAVAKRHMHRPTLIYKLPNLKIIDGILITDEERTRAQLYFELQQPSSVPYPDTTLPGIEHQFRGHVPVRVTNVQLMSPRVIDRAWAGITTINKDNPSPLGSNAVGRRILNSRFDPNVGQQQMYAKPTNAPLIYYPHNNSLDGNARIQ